MGGEPQKLELTWFNKDKALIPTENGKYGYTWVDPRDPRYCETHTLVIDEHVRGTQSPKRDGETYSERADLEPTDDNLLILGESGDVLEALTRVPELADKYVGQVKCIYIDPPFNTAQTFANYEDNLEHSIWLTMMRDRLTHLHKLLSHDGSIWVHLDNVENHRMRLLLDEVFGPGNFRAEVIWQKADSPRSDAGGFSADHDVILIYGRSENTSFNRMERTAADNARFSNPDDDPNGIWWDGDPTAPGAATHQGMVYAIQHPITGELMYPAAGRHWAFGQQDVLEIMRGWADYELRALDDKVERARRCGLPPQDVRADVSAVMLSMPLEEAARRASERHTAGGWPIFILRGKNGSGGIGRKSYPPEKGQPPRTWWSNDEVDHNRRAKAEIKALFPNELPFATPKPERLLERIIQIGSNPGDIILDIFAGSGTTAAVAQKMGRRWVTCELVKETMDRFTRPRLEKVVHDEDPGGITLTPGERVDATEDGLPEGLSATDAQQLTSLLNKAITDRDDLKASADIKALKSLVRTKKSKDTINWRGGGGFQVAHLSASCFDYDPELDLVTLTDAATGENLVCSVSANLNFHLTPEHRYFHGVRGVMRLVVVEGRLDRKKVDDLIAHLAEGDGLTIAATEIEDGVRQYLRSLGRGCRAAHIPGDIFRYSTEEA